MKGYPRRTVSHVYDGRTRKVLIADSLGEAWYDHDWPQLAEIKELKQARLKPGARVFDLGAHQSVVAMMLADAVGDTGQVVALEANAHNVAVSMTNRDLNSLSQLTIIHAAVADRDGTITFSERLNGFIADSDQSWGQVTVDSVTIDTLAARHGKPDVVFLDVEGAEVMALTGANQTLARGADFFIEVHVNAGLEKMGGSAARVLEFFPSERFSLLVKNEETEDFRPYQGPGDPLLKDRFFLLAIERIA